MHCVHHPRLWRKQNHWIWNRIVWQHVLFVSPLAVGQNYKRESHNKWHSICNKDRNTGFIVNAYIRFFQESGGTRKRLSERSERENFFNTKPRVGKSRAKHLNGVMCLFHWCCIFRIYTRDCASRLQSFLSFLSHEQWSVKETISRNLNLPYYWGLETIFSWAE